MPRRSPAGLPAASQVFQTLWQPLSDAILDREAYCPRQAGFAELADFFTQWMRAPSKKALEKAGKKGLEQSVFKNILEQLGKKLTKKATGRIMPVFGAAFGALFDTAQMKHIIDYADIFYRKRFIEEKELRINAILNPDTMDDAVIAYKESISK